MISRAMHLRWRLFPPLLAALSLATAGACLAPPPPIVVETPYGAVRAESPEKASEVAELVEELVPQLRMILPGCQQRAVEVWVQEELQVFRGKKRPASVRGFTLLADEFHARRIHLQQDGQASWYLAHELVHALVGPTWRALPGVLEEGLGDAVAERLNPDRASHIRAHRLLNAGAFAGGLALVVSWHDPRAGTAPWSWPKRTRAVRLSTAPRAPLSVLRELLGATRAELHQRWPEVPEPFYGVAWLLVSRIAERRGLDGLHELCLAAERDGHPIVPLTSILDAAEMDLDRLDADFLATCFDRRDFLTAIYLRPRAFAAAALRALAPLRGQVDAQTLLRRVRPSFVLPDGTEIPLAYVGPLQERIALEWGRPRPAAPPPSER